ncbi:MAG: amidase [Acetobacterales bacterium]
MTELCDLPAVDLRRMIGSKEISPVELFDSCARRIGEANPALNAMVEMRLDAARAEAEEAERAVIDGEDLGPLHGLPVAIKENADVAGLRTTRGSLLYKDKMAERDCGMVATVRMNGGIVIGKTNVPELTNGLTTDNPVYGLTRNAHDPERTCAGSSGGAGVALAASMVPLATGGDTGGSIRGPADVSGVWGLRPTSGLVPDETRPLGWSNMSVLGPMARSAADTRLLLQGMIATDSVDPLSAPIDMALIEEGRPADLGRLRVAVSPDLGSVELADGVRETFERKVALFGSAFTRCDWAHPDMGEIHRAYLNLRSLVHLTRYPPEQQTAENLRHLTPQARTDLRRGHALTATDIGWAHKEHTRVFRAFQEFFEDYDLLITPGRARPFYTLDDIATRNEKMVADEEAERRPLYGDKANINAPITMMGHPVLAAPAGRGPHGLPFGLQVIGPYRHDAMLLDVGLALDALFSASTDLARPVADLERFAQAA